MIVYGDANGASAPPQLMCCLCSFVDPFIGNREEKRLERRRRPGFDFIQQGRLQKQAEGQRLRVMLLCCCCC